MNYLLYRVNVLKNEETGEFGVIIENIEEERHTTFTKPTLRKALAEAVIRLKKHAMQEKRFPLSTILDSSGQLVNGH